jgi:hypothetical protein
VWQEKITSLISSVKVSLNHPLFFSRLFTSVSQLRKENGTNLARTEMQMVAREEYDGLSRQLDHSQIQESCSSRNLLRVRRLVRLLMNEKGELHSSLLPSLIEEFKNHLYSLGPQRQYDAKRQKHILNVLELLHNNKEVARLLKRATKPLSNKLVEDIIRSTLQLSSNTVITDAHVRQSVLAAWLTYLRQNIGSCFATAPAEIIHDEQPELFLQDMVDLIATGRLKRTFLGTEHVVPLSYSWGNADLKKPLFIQRQQNAFKPEIWYSPGLIAAFEAADLINLKETAKNKISQLKSWILSIFHQQHSHHFYFITTAEELIRTVLLQQLGLTEQNIKDYENRARPMVQSHLLMQMPSRNSRGLGDKSAYFLQRFEMAKNAFKALTDNALLKSWEFTLASFSESKMEFTRWNLYSSLGLGTQEPGGIGQCIYQNIQHKLDLVNRKVEALQAEYEMVFTQVKTLESRMRQASTEKEVQWLKIEYQSRASEFYFLQEQRDHAQSQARNLVKLYESLHTIYMDLFKDYFQEVYDADLQEITTGPFDDSPAGFRLLYKHGRSHPSQWSRIRTPAEFIDALSSFFVATEPQIASMLEKEGIAKELSDVITAIVNHVKTREFLETAFHRMAAAHQVPLIKDPLSNLDRVEKKPWVYTSGGTMETLISCYYCLEDKPKQASKWVESELELMVFLVDTIKHIPYSTMRPYLEGKRDSMLMQSPTHAFLLKPNRELLKDLWSSEEFTYTFVRDRVVKPAQQFIGTMLLNEDMMRFLVQRLIDKIPENYQPRFRAVFQRIIGPLTPLFFRDFLVETIAQDRGLQHGRAPILATEEIDSFLYSLLPVFPIYSLKDRLHQLLILLPDVHSEKVESILSTLDQVSLGDEMFMGANQLQDICKAILCLYNLSTSSKHDYHYLVSQSAQKLGFAMPTPLIFADTNWVKDEFGFTINPGTGNFELWRLDYTGSIGYPMSSWKEWLNGSRSDRRWEVYTKSSEYGQY